MIRMPLVNVSCKQRTGPAKDVQADYSNASLYSCVLPLTRASLAPIPNPDQNPVTAMPAYARHYAGPGIVPLATLEPSSHLRNPIVIAVALFSVGWCAGFTLSKLVRAL